MKTSRDELLRETLVRYYWRLVCNGAKALHGCTRWLLYSAQLQLYICIVSAI